MIKAKWLLIVLAFNSNFLVLNSFSEESTPKYNLVIPPLNSNPGSADEIKADELRKLAKKDPESASREVKNLKESNFKQWAFNRIAMEYANKDMPKAEQWLAENQNTENYNPGLAGISTIKGGKDYKNSVQWAKKLPQESRSWALAGIVLGNFKESNTELKNWSQKEKTLIAEYGEKIWNLNPNYSVVWTINASKKMAEAMLDVLKQLPPSRFRNQYINLVFTAWYQTYPEKAGQWLNALQEASLKGQLTDLVKFTEEEKRKHGSGESSTNPQ